MGTAPVRSRYLEPRSSFAISFRREHHKRRALAAAPTAVFATTCAQSQLPKQAPLRAGEIRQSRQAVSTGRQDSRTGPPAMRTRSSCRRGTLVSVSRRSQLRVGRTQTLGATRSGQGTLPHAQAGLRYSRARGCTLPGKYPDVRVRLLCPLRVLPWRGPAVPPARGARPVLKARSGPPSVGGRCCVSRQLLVVAGVPDMPCPPAGRAEGVGGRRRPGAARGVSRRGQARAPSGMQ